MDSNNGEISAGNYRVSIPKYIMSISILLTVVFFIYIAISKRQWGWDPFGFIPEQNVNTTQKESLPVGTVLASTLTEVQFNKEQSGQWVIADGRSVEGSKFAALTGHNIVVDLRGMFLRGLDIRGTRDPEGNSRELASFQQMDALDHIHKETRLVLEGNHWQHARSDQGQKGHSNNSQDATYISIPTGIPEYSAINIQGKEVRPINCSSSDLI
ncbi:hypothetical protein [Glaciecola sp. 1036]|uniref:hypothetical protein n=1 Tax=Alteromonadaceae TaxID=72275 RepID=UPI003D00462D